MRLSKRQKKIAIGVGLGSALALLVWGVSRSSKTASSSGLVERVVARAAVSETDLGVLRTLLAKLQGAGRFDLAPSIAARIDALEQSGVSWVVNVANQVQQRAF